jgi:hypothetical protein
MKKVQSNSQEGRFQPRRGKSSALLCENYRGTLTKPPRYFFQTTAVVYLGARLIEP